MRAIDHLLKRLKNVRKIYLTNGNRSAEWSASCPAHDDTEPSLSISQGDDGRVLLHCHAGCPPEAVVEAMGLKMADLFDTDNATRMAPVRTNTAPPKARKSWSTLDDATRGASSLWTYDDQDGNPALWVARFDRDGRKSFLPYHKNDDGRIVCGDPPGRLPLYRAPSLVDAETVFILEGEKCCDLARGLGLTATTSAHGAASAKRDKHDWSVLAGKPVVILPDADEPGRRYALQVATLLTSLDPPCNVRICDLPGLPEHGDIEEFVASRQPATTHQLRSTIEALADDVKPFKPSGTVSDNDPTAAAGDDGKGKKPRQADELVKLAREAGATFWHDPDGEAYATLPVGDHVEHYKTSTKPFRRWISRLFYDAVGHAPSAQPLQDALNVLEGIAAFEGAEYEVFTRYASVDDAVYIDLADEQWRAVRITRYGWTVETDVPVRFRRARGMLPIPTPTQGGNLADLRRLINAGDDSQFCLIVSWLVGCLMPRGPYPILELDGEQGSAKSTTARMLRRLIDPNEADLRTAPRDERDLVIAAKNAHVVAFDNLSGCAPWLSDALCRLATGAGFGTRELYSDSEEVLFSGSRPILLNGIGGVASRPDLLDRTLRVMLPRIGDDARKDERDLWLHFDKARPALLGAVLDAAVTALARIDSVKLQRQPRMADFARWTCAAEPALPWGAGEFLRSYDESRATSDQDAVAASAIGPCLVEFMATRRTWSGKAGDLLRVLDAARGDERPPRGWPSDATRMAKALRRIAPPLRGIGIHVAFGDKTDRTLRLSTEAAVDPAGGEGEGENENIAPF